MRRLLLFLVYYLLVTPVGLVARVIHDPLHRRRSRRARSYWTFMPPYEGVGRAAD